LSFVLGLIIMCLDLYIDGSNILIGKNINLNI